MSRGSIQRAVDQLLRTGGTLPSASVSSASDSASHTSASSSESGTYVCMIRIQNDSVGEAWDL